MATYDGSIRINTRLETSSFNQGVTKMMGSLKSLTSAIGVAFSITALITFGKKCVDVASDIAEVDNVVAKSFGSMREEMDALADTAIEKLGMSRLTAYQTGSTFMSMGKSMLKSTEDAKNMALSLTEMTGNMSSFFNVSQDQAMTALKSIYTGETETLKQYGVVMTETNLKQFALAKGIKTAYNQMSQSQKVALRYKYVMEQLSYVGSDFVDTQDSWANQTRILSEQWKEFMSVIGETLVVVLTPLIQILNNILSRVIALTKQISTAANSILGIQRAENEKAAESYDKLADSVEDYGDATEEAQKKAKNGLQSFDELNNISSKKSDTVSNEDISELAIDDYVVDLKKAEDKTDSAVDNITKMFQDLFNKIKEYVKDFIKGFADVFKQLGIEEQIKKILDSIKNIGKALMDIFTDGNVLKAVDNFIKTFMYNLGRIAASILSIGMSIAQALLEGFEKYLVRNTDRIKEYIITMFDVASEIMTMFGDLAVTMADIFKSVFTSDSMTDMIANIIQIFSDIFMVVTEISIKFARDLINIMVKPFVDNKDAITEAVQGTVDVISAIVGTIADLVRQIADGILQLYDEHISPFFESIANGLSEIVAVFLEFWNTNVKPILDEFAKAIDEIYQEHLKQFVDAALEAIGALFDALKDIWENVLVPLIEWIIQNILPVIKPILLTIFQIVKQLIGGIIDTLTSLVKAITSVFRLVGDLVRGDWKNAWQDAKSIVKNIINAIIDLIQGLINAVATAAGNIAQLFSSAGRGNIGSYSSNIQLPHLAKGGITTGATLAQIGEAGREAVLPLENNTGWMDDLADKIANKMGNNAGNIKIELVPDEMGIFKSVQRMDKQQYKVTGRSSFIF